MPLLRGILVLDCVACASAVEPIVAVLVEVAIAA